MADEPILIAPGREPDDFDAIMAKVRLDTTMFAPKKACRRCNRELPKSAFAAGEFGKERPMCTNCASMPVRKATGELPTDLVRPPRPPLNAHLARLAAIAERQRQEDEDAHYDAQMAEIDAICAAEEEERRRHDEYYKSTLDDA